MSPNIIGEIVPMQVNKQADYMSYPLFTSGFAKKTSNAYNAFGTLTFTCI